MKKVYYFLGHEQFHPEKLVKDAVKAEKSGFDGVFVSEHFNPWVADAGASGFAFSTLGAIANATEKIELMTGVVTPLFRFHPAVIAQASATIDRLSSGRFYLGIGTGERINEVPLGYEFPDYTERSERMREAIDIIRSLLDGKKISYKGKFYKTEKTKLYSPPIKRIPIFMASGGPKSAKLAAEKSDGLIISVKDIGTALEKIIEPAKKINDQLKIISTRWTVYSKSEDEAIKALKPWRGLRAPGRDKAMDPEELQSEADNLDRNEILSKYKIVSSPKDYIETYSPLFKELDSDTVVIQTTALKDAETLIEMLGKEVVPHLKSL